jgi:hypothetical protein
MDGGGSIAAADDGTNGDDNDIDQEMFAIASVPGVVERFEVRGYPVTRNSRKLAPE